MRYEMMVMMVLLIVQQILQCCICADQNHHYLNTFLPIYQRRTHILHIYGKIKHGKL